MGRAPRTIDAYARGLAEYLLVCERDGIDPVAANRLHVAAFVKELSTRPSRRGANVVALDSGAGLANATLQQRLVSVRLFYDYLRRRDCGSPTRSAVAATHPAGISADTSEGWYPG
ncbi:site-specific integrase [Streptosporangium album]|uniref:site-specific integrase n=1 Tax=Streptosporangium album TaxID=47479 RepID=UPI00248455E3|nr:site-specific integrase [Streptosporangium album]